MSMPVEPRTEADKLREQAKGILNKIFRDSGCVYTYDQVDTLVDCVVSTAILEISAVMLE